MLAAFPDDAEALVALSRALWLRGRSDEARAVLDDAPSFSLTGSRAADAYASIAADPPSTATVAFPRLAERALRIARCARQREAALRAYRRALALDPHRAAATEAIDAMAT